MINFITSGINIENAKMHHLDFFKILIENRIEQYKWKIKRCRCTVYKKPDDFKVSDYAEKLVDFILEKGVKKIVIGQPRDLENISDEFYRFIKSNYGFDFKEGIKRKQKDINPDLKLLLNEIKDIFNYKHFIQLQPSSAYSAYHLASNLNVRSCTYCNRTYTVTRTSSDNGKLMRPQLDHWYPKAFHPLLAISFYNLIPSCYSCNSSVKGSINLDLDIHTHPYVSDDKSDDLLFDYEHFKKIDDYNIFLKEINTKHKKSLTTAQVLKINQMYNAHTAELKDLLLTAKEYSIDYLEILQKSFPGANLSKQEVYRLAFGVELESKDFYKKPMSKFKHDILKEIGILKED